MLNLLFSDGSGELHTVRLQHFFCGILSSLYAAKWSSGAFHSAFIAATCAEAAVALVNEQTVTVGAKKAINQEGKGSAGSAAGGHCGGRGWTPWL